MSNFSLTITKTLNQQAANLSANATAAASLPPMPNDIFGPKEWNTILAIADTFVPPVDPSVIRPYASAKYSANNEDDIRQFAALCPSTLGEPFKDSLRTALRNAPLDSLQQVALVLRLLGNRTTAVFLTGSPTLFTAMSREKREQVLLGWRDSRLAAMRKLYRSLYDVLTVSFIRPCSLAYRLMGHPEFEPKLSHPERFVNRAFFEIPILNLGDFAVQAEISVDVVIVGSGAGCGVVASRVSRAGYSVLVLEKGKYFHQRELQFNEDAAYSNLYESGGSMVTEDGGMLVLAGSTLGGATTVNWSASLRTPDNIRKEWANYGAPFYSEKVYDDAMDYVMNMMGCSDEGLAHSFTNQLILDGSAKLGYKAKPIPQNSGGHRHDCGFCSFGCRFGEKQGGVVCWLRDAVEHGAKISDRTEVMRVVHSNGKATGVEAIVKGDKIATQLRVRAKSVIVAGGSLSTPGVLMRSKFRNKHIGKGLTLHPVTVMMGAFPEKELNAYDDTIMTAVCTEVDNLDGNGHGPKIEAILHQPATENHFIQWQGGSKYRQDMLRYNRTSALLIITRDKGQGRVAYNSKRPLQPRVHYAVSSYDCWALLKGCIAGSNLLYIEGAQKILPPTLDVPPFESSKPKEERNINDPDYQKWLSKFKTVTFEPLRIPFGTAHQMSSCRMSNKGPRVAPLNDRGQLWECKNVYVADASVLPTASGVNPMISTMATAHIIAGNIIDDLARKQARL